MLTRLLAAAAFAAVPSFSAIAATQTLDVDLTVTADNTGNFIGTTGTATLVYDDAALNAGNSFSVDYIAEPVPFFGVTPPGFDFNLNMFGQTFADPNDIDSILKVTTTIPTRWSLSISESDATSPTAITDPAILGFSTSGSLIPDIVNNRYSVNVIVNDIVAPIPLPATASLLGAGLFLLGAFVRRRRKAV